MLCLGGELKLLNHIKCNSYQKLFYYDVVSLYPTVNALDPYAVGFKKYVNITVNMLILL